MLLLQEHHVLDPTKLATVQSEMLDYGFSGVWAPASPSPSAPCGTVGGVAILAKTSIVVTAPPLLKTPVLHKGRLAAAHVHWGVGGGLVMLSVYLVDSAGCDAVNQGILLTLLRYLVQLNAAGYDWIVGGGFNMHVDSLKQEWGTEANGIWATPKATTCRPNLASASTIDYFFVAANLCTRIFEPTAHEQGTTAPHLPVMLPLACQDLKITVRVPRAPRPIGAVPPTGCARGVEDWTKQLAKVRLTEKAFKDGEPMVRVQKLLVKAWDAVLDCTEQELLDR